MGLRGPAPQPIETKRMRGNPGKRALPKNAPMAGITGEFYQPDDLDEGAREEWDRLVPMLMDQGILSNENYLVVAMICRLESRGKQARALIAEQGMSIPGQYGPVNNPMLRVARDCEAQLRPLYREVGITPSSRGGVARAEKKVDDPWAALDRPPN